MKPKKLRPVSFTWLADEGRMVPSDIAAVAICRKQFTDRQAYPMEVVQQRSMPAHRRYFAALHDGWLNLSEEYKDRFKTDEHLRAYALVHTGFCTEVDYPFESRKDALLAARIIRTRSAYSVIKVSGDVVKVFDPESQAVYGPNAMPPERFKESSNAVLDLIATMARTTRDTLLKEGGQSA